MSTLIKSVSLKGTAELDVSRFKDGLQQIGSMRRQFEKNPLKIPVQLDLKDIRSQAAKVAAEIKKAVGAALGTVGASGGTVSKGGLILPPGAVMELEKFRSAAGKEFKRIETDINNGKGRIIQSFEQLGQGIEKVTTTTLGKKGKSVSVKMVDTRPMNDLKRALDQIDRNFSSRIGAAKGNKGDLAAVLTEQKVKVQKAINDFAALEGSPEWRKANRMLDSLDRRIGETSGKQAQDTARQKASDERKMRSVGASLDRQRDAELRKQEAARLRSERQMRSVSAALDRQRNSEIKRQNAEVNTGERRSAQRAIVREDRALQAAIKKNKADESAARAIRNQVTRETELNRVLDERERLIGAQAQRYEQLSARQRSAGRTDAADKFEDAGMRQRNDLNQVRLDRTREANAGQAKVSDQVLERAMARKMAEYRLERQRLDQEEKLAKKIKDRGTRESALNDIMGRRKSLTLSTGADMLRFELEGDRRGNERFSRSAEGNRKAIYRNHESSMTRHAAATRNSGHALDFHSSSLLKNAATFTKWYVPAQAAMGVIGAFTKGLGDAVAAERTFKVLEAVFQGSTEDAKKLANQTLLLASANGRSSDEAAHSAVAWSRLGLTRTQVLLALETSLRAANVAEITSAEATEYLTATYKAFGLTISDLPPLLDYLNALSNRYNVTNKDLFEGISRTASVAKQAGLEFEDLAGIITVVTANTGRPGQEIGNALKFIINRARTPEVMKNLREEFNLDITGPTGDVKKFSDILADLAAIYPGLSRLEKARLNDIVSGARQGNRFAIIMENWTDQLIAQAKAGLDANSAMRENQKALGSVDAQLQSVSTAWTALLHTLGEQGVFDATAQSLWSIAEALRGVGEATEKVKPDKFAINDRSLRDHISVLLNDNPIFGSSPSRRSADELRKAIEVAKAVEVAEKKGRRGWGLDQPVEVNGETTGYFHLGGDGYKGRRKSVYRAGLDSLVYQNGETPTSVRQKLEQELATLTGNKATTDAKTRTTDILNAQKRVNSMSAAQQAFEAMSRDVTAVGNDPTKLLKQFDDAVSLLEALPGGLPNVAKARLEVRPLLEQGRTAEAGTALAGIGKRFSIEGAIEYANVEQARKEGIKTLGSTVEETRAELTKLNQDLAKEPDSGMQQSLQQDIAKTTDRLKEQEEALRTLQRGFEKPVTDPLNGLKDARINDYFKDLKLASEAMGGVMENFSNTGFGNLDAKLKLGSARMYGDLVEHSLGQSIAQNSGRMSALREGIGAITATAGPYTAETQNKLDALNAELALHQAIEDKFTNELNMAREASKEIERKIELERQVASIKESYDDGATSAAARAQSFAIGRTDGERIVNQTQGVFNQINGWNTIGSIHDPWLGQEDANQDARELGALTNNMAMAKQGIASMEDRMNRALAERVNLEQQIGEEQRKQTQEAAKRLAMASREDQLRATGAAAVLRNRGTSQFSMQEFQFYSQETRGAIGNLMPGSVKGLDDNARTRAESRKNLDDEISLLATSLMKMRKEFESFRPHAENVAGGLIDPKSSLGGVTSGQRVTDLNKSEVKVNLNLGEVRIDLDFGRHVAELRGFMQQHFDIRFQQLAADLRASLGPFGDRTPSTGAANSTF